MTWIKTIDFKDAEGELKSLYERVKAPSGHIDNILQAHSLRPRTLAAHLALYKATIHTKPNGLLPRERELVGVCVSLLNGCDYCVEHHRAGLARHLGSTLLALELSDATVGKRDSAHLTDRERALCIYATKLTKTPAEMQASDLTPLRMVGLDDAGILDLNQIVAYFAYANRTVLGLGVSTSGELLGLHPDENEEGFKHK